LVEKTLGTVIRLEVILCGGTSWSWYLQVCLYSYWPVLRILDVKRIKTFTENKSLATANRSRISIRVTDILAMV